MKVVGTPRFPGSRWKRLALGASRHRRGPPTANENSRRLAAAALAVAIVTASLSSVGAATSRDPSSDDSLAEDPPVALEQSPPVAREDPDTATLILTASGAAEYAGKSVEVTDDDTAADAVTVTDNDIADDATLSLLSLSEISLTFVSVTEAYEVDVPVEVFVTTVSATTTNQSATFEITTPADADGDTAGHQVSLDYGENVIEVVVTAQDGIATKSYMVTVDRARRWPEARANEWGDEHGWLVGANYVPRYAINQLEHWQADTFDIDIIDEELCWAADLGMNVMRVYLHDLVYKNDQDGFLDRINQYLSVSASHGIATILVLFDDVWNPNPVYGTQPEPTPHIHNSGWVQSPGRVILGDLAAHDSLKPYVTWVISNFDDDDRVIAFEVYNEPGQDNRFWLRGRQAAVELQNKSFYSLALLEKVFQWAREANPAQPIFASAWRSWNWTNRVTGQFVGWDNIGSIDRYAFEYSDIIGFHSYLEFARFSALTTALTELFDRPILATEYMAREEENTFALNLPFMHGLGVSAVNWGLVNGKTQTVYPWNSWYTTHTSEPNTWFHDVLRSNGLPFDPAEAALIRSLTGTTSTARTSANQKPVFNDGDNASRSLAENVAANQDIGTPIDATDGDDDTLTYLLMGTDADSFEIDASSGQLSTKSGITYDYEDSYSVTIRVKDGECGATSIDVTINVTGAIAADAVTVAEGAEAQLAVQLAVRPTASVTVAAAGTSGTDLTVSGFPLTFTTANWDTAQSVTVAAGEDPDAVDDTATLVLTASGAIEYAGKSVDVTVTVTDNDIGAIAAGAVTVVEGAEAQLAVQLAVRPTASVTVAAAGTSGTDLTVSGFPLTFTTANWDTAQSVTVAAGEDPDAVDDSATLVLTASGAAEYAGVSVDVEVTVTDNNIAGLEELLTRFSFWDNKDWDWYLHNIPLIETPNSRLDEVYYYRWQLVAMHLRYASPLVGYVATEANNPPGYAGGFGAIVAASGHQLYEMQWLRDRRFAEDHISFFLSQHSSKPYSYTSWLAENVWSLNKVHGNDAYARGVLSELVKYYEHYEEMQFNPTLGLFWSVPAWDAMEHTASSKRAIQSRHGGDGYRPTLNSYMYANALAIQDIATMAGESSLAAEYGRKAAALKANMQNRLWDDDRNFFLHMYRLDEKDDIQAGTLIDDTGLYTADKKGREHIGFIPWAFNLPDDQAGAGYEAAWQFFDDAAYFQAPYGPRTAELSDHLYGLRTGHWSGASWPFATTQSLKAMANVVQNYDQTEVSRSDYIAALNIYVNVHKRGTGNPYIAIANHPETGSWAGYNQRNRSEHYFHSGFVDLVLSGLFGLQPQDGDTLVLKPLVPAGWDYFLLDNLRYHGRDVTIVWDRDGAKYNRGSGFRVFVDDVRVHRSDAVPDSVTINVGSVVDIPRDDLVNYAVNNTAQRYPEATASNSFRHDPPREAANGKYYYTDVPTDRWTSYQSRASEDTFSVDFGQGRPIHTVKLYIYDDGGGVQTPSSYQIQYWNGSSWADVQETSRNPATPTGNRANVVEFSEVSTSRVRAVLSRNAGIAVGMTEFEAWGPSQPVADSPASDNLALNADAWKYPRIYPSFAYINDAVFRAHDGNRNTFWSNRESRNGINEFLRVDFGEEETFKTVEVNFRDAPTSMNLEYLNNGSWTAIPDVRMTPATPADNTTTTATFPAITTEQIRINLTTTGTTQSNGFISNDAIISIREIEIYEDGPGVTVVGDDLTVYEGGDETYTVVLTSQPTGDVTVAINDPTDHGDVTASPASLTFTSSNWNREQGVTVTASPDDDTLDEEAMVTHTVSSTDAHYNALAVEDVTVTVIDSNLRARFEQVPTRHDGSSEFRFQLHFSEDVSLRHTDFSGTLFETTGGTVTGARRLNRPHSDSGLQNNSSWEVVATPDGSGDMVITLPAGRGCDTDGAVCSRNEDRLGATVAATIAGPGPYVTARFEQVPSSHDGSTELRFQLHFSENVRLNHTDFSGALFETAGGTVTGARRLDPSTNTGWEVVARPDGTDDMVITLPEGRDCNTDGAVCTSDRSWLGATVVATIAGPGVSVTARFEQVPTSHDGSSEFRFQLHFSENVRLNHTDFSGALFETAGGTVTGARRLDPPSNIGWEVVARPDGDGNMIITLPAGRGCDTDGAVCAPDGSWLASTITTTIAGPGPTVTARFEQVPSNHDGSSEFRFQLHFSEEVDLSATDFTGALFITAGGTVISATPLQPPSTVGWEVVARPDGTDDMVITLPEGRGCNTDGAVCAPDGSWLASTVVATIAGPTDVTARFEQVPSNHDGSSEFRFQLHFSEKVRLNHTDFSGALFETAGGTVTGARRLDPPSNIGWEVVARPDGDGNMIITLPAGRACNTDGAVCAPDGSWLAVTISTTIAGPAGVP